MLTNCCSDKLEGATSIYRYIFRFTRVIMYDFDRPSFVYAKESRLGVIRVSAFKLQSCHNQECCFNHLHPPHCLDTVDYLFQGRHHGYVLAIGFYGAPELNQAGALRRLRRRIQ